MAAATQASALGRRHVRAEPTRDRAVLRSFLERDRLFAAYAICDLDDREFGRTRWGVAYADDDGHEAAAADGADRCRPIALALEYTGLSPQPLFVMGDPVGVGAVLREVVRPRVAYLAALTDHLPQVEPVYRIEGGPPMVRMWVNREGFRRPAGDAERLSPSEIGDLNRLYNLGFTSWLPRESIATGVYYGVRVGGKLVAAAGTHVMSPQARLAVVGNVMTHRDHRGRGYAKLTTGAVTEELLRTCEVVVLNVRSDNPPALAAYRALGFREHVRFEERLVHRRGALWDSIVAPIRRLLPASWSAE